MIQSAGQALDAAADEESVLLFGSQATKQGRGNSNSARPGPRAASEGSHPQGGETESTMPGHVMRQHS